jgi:hypothetical protein
VSELTGYAPVELLSGDPRSDIFGKLLKKEADQCPKEEALADKLLKAYARMKVKAEKRNRKRKTGRTQWEPHLQELVLVKCQPLANSGDPMKDPISFRRKLTPPDTEGKLRGRFNIKHLKPYLSAKDDEKDLLGKTK